MSTCKKKSMIRTKSVNPVETVKDASKPFLTHHFETVCMWSLRSSKKRRLCDAASGPRPPGGLYTSQCPLILGLALSLAWGWEDGLNGWRDKILGGRGDEGTEVGMLSPYALSEIAASLGMGTESDTLMQSGLIWPWQKWPHVPVRPCVRPALLLQTQPFFHLSVRVIPRLYFWSGNFTLPFSDVTFCIFSIWALWVYIFTHWKCCEWH